MRLVQMLCPVYPRLIEPESPTVCELYIGDMVELLNKNEYFWAEIIDVKTRGYLYGIVVSRLKNLTSYVFHDIIRFHEKYIYRIKRSESRQYS